MEEGREEERGGEGNILRSFLGRKKVLLTKYVRLKV
jgi:hypothetical protein